MGWLMVLVGFLACLIVPTWVYERRRRSDYREYVRYQRALEAQRDEYVPPVRDWPTHRPTIVRAGIVK